MIKEAESKGEPLSDEELSFVNAAGEINPGKNESSNCAGSGGVLGGSLSNSGGSGGGGAGGKETAM